jgi:tellurite resistance protein TehA-like permease
MPMQPLSRAGSASRFREQDDDLTLENSNSESHRDLNGNGPAGSHRDDNININNNNGPTAPTDSHRSVADDDRTDGPRREPDTDLEASRRHAPFPRRSDPPLPLKERVVRVTWAWFSCTMSTGGIANLISQQPFTFPGLRAIGKVFYILNLVLFATFSVLIASRFALKPRALLTSLHHPSESFFFGSFWVSIALILIGAQAYGGPATGDWFVTAMRVVYWIYYACETLVAVFQYHVIFESERNNLSEALPSWILPAYPFLVTGLLAGTIAQKQESGSAVQILVAGLMGQGLGWMLALFIYAVYLTRLIQYSMPEPSKAPGMYIAVGPAGKNLSIASNT